MSDGSLGAAVEAAALRAWPAIEETELDGWRLRYSEGFTGRANSVQALAADVPSDAPAFELRLASCERWYAERGRPSLFRMTPFSEPGLDDFLGERGYACSNHTHVLYRSSRGLEPVREDVLLDETKLGEWIRRYASLVGLPAAPEPMRKIIERSAGRSLPAILWKRRPRRAVACGLAVLDGTFLGLFDLVVDAAERRQGLGAELVLRLVEWGRRGGAEHVYLQVTVDNGPALSLYGKLGFEPAYDYWYRGSHP